MFQKFYTKTLESNFIKNLLYSTPLPLYRVVSDGNYIFKDEVYIYHDSIIKCIKSGYLSIENYRVISPYEFGKDYPKFTERFISNFDYYDAATHEQLGKYLRCIKNFYGIDLMPFYNCYSSRVASNFYIYKTHVNQSVEIEEKDDYKIPWQIHGTIEVTTNTTTDVYKYANADVKVTDNILEEILSEAEMDEALIFKNIGRTFLYLGETTDKYVNGRLYTVNLKTDTAQVKKTKNSKKKTKKSNNPYSYDKWEYNEETNIWNITIVIKELELPVSRYNVSISIPYIRYELESDVITIYADEPPYDDGTVSIILKYTATLRVPNYQVINEPSTIYKVAQVPIKFNQDYTIAMDSYADVILAPAIISKDKPVVVYDTNKTLTDLTSTLNDNKVMKPVTRFKQPFIYRVDLDPSTTYAKQLEENEKNLYLLIQIPTSISTSIVVLEGDYTLFGHRTKHFDSSIIDTGTDEEKNKLFLSALSLLKLNDKNSYAFSDRLIEYLTLNVICPNEDIDGNVGRVQEALGIYPEHHVMRGIWSDRIRLLAYRLMMVNNRIEHYDLNGFIDKDTEINCIKE